MLTHCIDREELTVSSTAKALTTSKFTRTLDQSSMQNIKYADVHVIGANIRVTCMNGVTATTDIGAVWYAGSTMRVWGQHNMTHLSMIRDDSTDAEVVVEYWGS